MEVRSLSARWRDGATTLGAWISLRDPLLAEVAGQAGFDYVVIDMQHGLNDYGDVVGMVQAMAGTATVPLVRVPWNDQGTIGRVLDAGALGVIIPMVNTVDEARRAVAACRYAPDGTRSVGPLIPRVRYGPDYWSIANDTVVCIPMIETRQAIEGIDEILEVPGVDAVYVGPADLSMTYGLVPRVDQHGEPFDGALATVVEACRRHDVTPGIHANTSLAATRHAAGFRMITVGFDAAPAIAALQTDARIARAAIDAAPA
ncbi:MAG: aldolase/citrate lyase family protein [Ilumatobacteraceae bacterium]